MTVIQPPGVQWMVSLLQLKLDLWHFRSQRSISRKEVLSLGILCRWPFWVIKHIWYDYGPRFSWRIRHNHELQWSYGHLGYWHYSNERQRLHHFIISRGPDWDIVYVSANEPQTLRDEYSQATKILDAEYKQTSSRFDDVIKTCENLHVEEQHQLKALLQKYEHLFDEYWKYPLRSSQLVIRISIRDTED
jgi:hypothetical protein